MSAYLTYSDFLRKSYYVIRKTISGPELDLFTKHEAFRTELVNLLAERLAVRAGFVPLTFTADISCNNCGPVVAPNDWPTDSKFCPWCDKSWSAVTRKLSKELKEYEAKEGRNRLCPTSKAARSC